MSSNVFSVLGVSICAVTPVSVSSTLLPPESVKYIEKELVGSVDLGFKTSPSSTTMVSIPSPSNSVAKAEGIEIVTGLVSSMVQSLKGEVPELFVTEQVVTAEFSIELSVGKTTFKSPPEGIVFSGVRVSV